MSGTQETWWSYECYNHKGTTGVIVDIRIDNEIVKPESGGPKLVCPLCLAEMVLNGSWPSDEHGYGSQGDRSCVQISRGSLGRLIWAAENSGRTCKRCHYYDDSYCNRWNHVVEPNHYCSEWEKPIK